MKELKRLNKFLIKYKYRLLLGVLFVTASNIFSVFIPHFTGQAIDLIKENASLYYVIKGVNDTAAFENQFVTSVIFIGGLILGSALLRGVFLYLTRQTIIVMSRFIEYDMKNEIFSHYQQLPISFYRSHNTGDLMNRISEDVSKVRMYIGPAIMYGLNLIVLFVLTITKMYAVNSTLATYTLLPLPLLSICIYYVSSRMDKQSTKIQQNLSGLSTFVQEAFSGIKVLKAFSKEKEFEKQFLVQSDVYKRESLKLSMINALFYPVILGLIGLSTISVVYVGGLEVIAGNASLGNIAEFVMYVSMLTWPVASLGWVTSIVQSAAASQRRISEFLNTEATIISEKNLDRDIEGEITFENVKLTYPDSNITAVESLSFIIKKGESLAIVGGTGSGKSTIANLITRLYDPTEGVVKIDGVDIKDYNIPKLREQIGYVPQDVFLFSDSIGNNIAFGMAEVDKAAVEQAAKDAGVYRNIIDFPHQFDTVLGERGITLSGGQKQRVTLARALIRNPKILILDDSLSAVDTKTEDEILSNLQRIMKGRTTVIVSHRVSSVKLADKIAFLEDGRISEIGTHDELMLMNGSYKSLYDSQLEETVG